MTDMMKMMMCETMCSRMLGSRGSDMAGAFGLLSVRLIKP